MDFIKEFKEAMNENIELNEMAYSKSKAEEIVKGLDTKFSAHWAYIFLMGSNFVTYGHWKKEESNFCEQIDNIKLKQKGNSRLDRDYLVDTICPHIDTDKDAEIFATWAWSTHDDRRDQLPAITSLGFTREDFHQFKDFLNDTFEIILDMFVDKEDHSKEEYQVLIDSQMRKFNR